MGNIKYELRKILPSKKKDKKVDSDNKKDNMRRIYIIYWTNGIRFSYSTGQKIDINLWRKDNCGAIKRKGRADLAALNNLLDVLGQRIKSAERELITNGKLVTKQGLKELTDKMSGKREKKLKYLYIDEYGEHVVKRYKKMGKSYSAINSTVKMMKAYKPHTLFDDVDLNYHNNLVSYMKDKDKNGVKNYSKNYIATVIAKTKLIMELALVDGYTKNKKHRTKQFTAKREKVYNIYLSMEEIEHLHKHVFQKDYLDNACDLFIIGSLTGLRFSDYNELGNVNFADGEFVIQDTMKVDGRLVIPQHRIVKEILAKRNGQLPRSISNVKLNKYLKEIGKAAKLNSEVMKMRTEGAVKVRKVYKKYQLITTHTARRSLATNMYLANIPIKTIMAMTGHSSVKQLMEYIKITEVEMAQSLVDHPFFK